MGARTWRRINGWSAVAVAVVAGFLVMLVTYVRGDEFVHDVAGRVLLVSVSISALSSLRIRAIEGRAHRQGSEATGQV